MRNCGGVWGNGEDAFGALTYLRSLPFVDGKRIGVMGWSYGATAALRVATTSAVVESEPRDGGFRVSVAFYPRCDAFGYDTNIPVLMLLGGNDDWTPPAQCVAAAEALIKRGGSTVEWTVYPGATHNFDNSELRAGNRCEHGSDRSCRDHERIRANAWHLGHSLEYDANATADAEKRVGAFLATHLRGTR
jgi:dienelactone hydrolase